MFVKKLFLLGLICTSAVLSVPAQAQPLKKTADRGPLSIQAGFSHFKVQSADLEHFGAEKAGAGLSSPFISLTYKYESRGPFTLKHQLSFLRKGTHLQFMETSGSGEPSGRLDLFYLEILPLAPSLSFAGFDLYAGPYLAALTHAGIKRPNSQGQPAYSSAIFGDAERPSGYLNKTDLGYALGLSYELPAGLSLGAKWSKSWTGLIENTEIQHGHDRGRNRGLQLALGYAW